VVYIYCKKGGRSSTAANQLKEKGYRVFNLLGGLDAWKQAKKPISN
jgi:phage shock protein E